MIDFREGGKYVFAMRAPADQGGQDSYTAGVYKKIVPMERLEFTQGLSDKDGNPIDPAQMGMPPDFPKEIRTVIVFSTQGQRPDDGIDHHRMQLDDGPNGRLLTGRNAPVHR